MFQFNSKYREHDRTHFFKYLPLQAVRSVLCTQKLRYSSPLRFNDPLDVPEELEFAFTDQELQDAASIEFVNRLEQGNESIGPPGGPADTLLKLVAQTDEELRLHLVNEMRDFRPEYTGTGLDEFRTLWKNQVPTLRILCLSEVNDNLAMWNHYADEYRGAVLRFECADELDSALLLARPVQYSERPLDITSKDVWTKIILDYDEEHLQRLFVDSWHHKTPEWGYEREWRVVGFAREGEIGHFADYGFHSQELSEVYLGPHVTSEDERVILSLLRGELAHAIAFRGEFDKINRRIVFEQIR